MKQFTVVTLFPQLIEAYRQWGVLGRACKDALIDLASVNPRDYASDSRGTVDDASYGGGPGMVMQVAPLRAAIKAARDRSKAAAHVVHLSPQGRRLDQLGVELLSGYSHLVLVCGRYEGIDERVIDADVDSEWSVGDYVVSGGEVPAMLMIDAITRTLPGALGDAQSAVQDSFYDDLLDHPHYSRPETVDGASVPAVLLSGDHAAIARWRHKQRLGRTWSRRPDLLSKRSLSVEEQALIDEFVQEQATKKLPGD